MDFEWIPFRLADKLKRLMCLGIRPNPNYVYRRTFCMVLRCHANTLVYCPTPNSTADHNLWEHRLLHGHRQISHELFFPNICWDPKSIPFVVFPCFHLGFHFHRPAIRKKIQRKWPVFLCVSIESFWLSLLFTTYLRFFAHIEFYHWNYSIKINVDAIELVSQLVFV